MYTLFPSVNKTTTILPPDSNNRDESDEKHSSTGAIVGGVVGGVASVTVFIACFILYRRREQKKMVNNRSTESTGNQEHLTPWIISSHGFTSSNTELSNPKVGNMGQVSRDRDHIDTVPIPFLVQDSPTGSTLRDPSSKNRTADSISASQSTTTPRPNAGSNTGTGQSSSIDRDDLRDEVNNLRMEIERMREGTAPPSYRI